MQVSSVSPSQIVDSVNRSANVQGAPKASFARTLTEAVSQVNSLQLKSSQSGQELATGTADSIHKVVLEAEEASLSMQMLVSLRNKALDAYQEVMRMQV